MDWSKYHRILSTFASEQLSISDFIICVLKCNEDFDPQFRSLIDDLFARTGDILVAFALQQRCTEISTKWAHTLACQLYTKEIDQLLRTETGLQFNVSKASHDQIVQFNSGTLVERMSRNAPRLWDLARTLLSARKCVPDSEEYAEERRVLGVVSIRQLHMHSDAFKLIY